jgi:branched-chain amino acid transport system substrate-binding protein
MACLDLDYGKIGFAAAEKEAKSFGLKIVDKELVPLGALETGTQVMSLKRAQPDYVILHLEPAAGAAVLRDAYKLGFKTQWIGTYYTTSEDLLRISRKAAEGFIGVHSYNSWYEDAPGMAELRKVTLKHEPGTEKPYRPKYYVQGWVDALILSEGMRRAGQNLTPEALVESIESIKNFDTRGLCGPITYGPDKHKGNEHCRFYKADIDNAILIPITDWIKPAE